VCQGACGGWGTPEGCKPSLWTWQGLLHSPRHMHCCLYMFACTQQSLCFPNLWNWSLFWIQNLETLWSPILACHGLSGRGISSSSIPSGLRELGRCDWKRCCHLLVRLITDTSKHSFLCRMCDLQVQASFVSAGFPLGKRFISKEVPGEGCASWWIKGYLAGPCTYIQYLWRLMSCFICCSIGCKLILYLCIPQRLLHSLANSSHPHPMHLFAGVTKGSMIMALADVGKHAQGPQGPGEVLDMLSTIAITPYTSFSPIM